MTGRQSSEMEWSYLSVRAEKRHFYGPVLVILQGGG